MAPVPGIATVAANLLCLARPAREVTTSGRVDGIDGMDGLDDCIGWAGWALKPPILATERPVIRVAGRRKGVAAR
jgi:hypothetical protein